MDVCNLKCRCGFRPVCITLSEDGVSCNFLKTGTRYKTIVKCNHCGAKFEGPLTNGWFEARNKAMKNSIDNGTFEYEF